MTDMKTHARHMVDAAREAQSELALAWTEMGKDAAAQMREANFLARFESRMDHIDTMIQDQIRHREILEAKAESSSSPALARVYKAQIAAVDANIESFAIRAEELALQMTGAKQAIGDGKIPDDVGDDKVIVREHVRRKSAK